MYDAELDTSAGAIIECPGGCGQIIRSDMGERARHLYDYHPNVFRAVYSLNSPLGKAKILDLWAWERERYALRQAAQIKMEARREPPAV